MWERFELGARVNGGGMGDVYRAVDRVTGDVVAVKRMRTVQAEATQRFLRESRLLEAVSHPGIVRYVAHGIDDDGAAWLAMEWLDGEDLGERLARKALAPAESLEVAALVAEALGAAHRAGVVHRDVKPSNVFLVGRDPKDVRLLDLGIAKPLRGTAITAAGMMVGTIGYLSPEQARGKPVDARSDVFSLGCLLFECLTGRSAYHAEHAAAVVGKLLTEAPPAPSSVDPSFARYDALFARLLAPLEQRLSDGAAVARAIRALEAEASGAAAKSVPPSKLTDRERQALTVVLARPHGLDPSGATEAEASEERKRQRLAHAAAAAHARHEWLPGGLFLFVWELDSARDQTIRAARFALALQHEGGYTIALATGFGERAGSNAVGGVIDRAASLVSRAGEVSVALDPASIEILRHRFEIDGARLGAELARAHEIADRTPFVGRDREMRLITSLLDECVADGTTRAILVTGEAGAGKSRLLRELLRRSAPERVWIARGDPMRPGSPYTMLSQLLRRAAGMSATATDRGAFVRALRALVADEGALELLAHVAGFVDEAPSAALRAAQNSPSVMATHIRQAALALCAAGAGEGLLVVMLEDLHWADAPSLRVFESLVHAVEHPIFIVGAARPTFHETFPGIWTSQGVEELRLAGLARKAAEALALALRPGASSEAVRHAVDRAGGSPLWLEELFRHGGGDSAETPDSLLAVIQTHLAREPSNERLVLRAAAVFGERAWLDGIALLAGRAASEIELAVASLVEKEWLVPLEASRFAGEREVRFRHGLLRDAAYAALTSEDRKVGHRLAAEWLRAAGERDALSLAEHYERSETPAAAIPHFVVAAREASMANDLDAALLCAARGIALGATGSDLHRLLLAEGSALSWRGKVREGWRSFDRALRETATASADPAVVSWAAMSGAMNMDASMTRRAANALESLDPATCPGDDYQQAASFVVVALYWDGERERADAVLAKLALLPDDPDPRARGWNAHSRAQHARFSLGNTWLDRAACLESERAFEEARDPAGYGHSLSQLVIAELSLDAREEATAYGTRGYAQAQKYSLPILNAWSLPVTALAMPDPASARARVEESIRSASMLGDGVFGAYSLVLTAHVQRILGDPEGAIDTLTKVLSQEPAFAVDCACHMQLAGALFEAGRAEEAAAECMTVVAATQHRHLHGALDLDFFATSAETMLAVGQVDACRMVLARGQKVIARRADAIDEPARRERFLTCTFAQRLRRVAAELAR
ncbi:MAG: AAA family ATPase [Labilithrix sp.]|nr:AAA family ATPase [Labilithrix sp.]MCW5813057.1 AAA family ATPase [Labilithrix sp.]